MLLRPRNIRAVNEVSAEMSQTDVFMRFSVSREVREVSAEMSVTDVFFRLRPRSDLLRRANAGVRTDMLGMSLSKTVFIWYP